MSDKSHNEIKQNSLGGVAKLSTTPMVGVGDSVSGLGKLSPTMKSTPASSGSTVSSVVSRILKG